MRFQRIRQSVHKHPKAWYYLLLAGAVTVAFLGTNAWMLARGCELVWTQDALPLYANFLVWADQAFWQTVGAALSGQGLEFPQYTNAIGYGADVPVTMGSYLQDPINLVVFALPNEWIGFSYSLMTLVRMVLSAYAFSWYCFSRGNGRRATGIAAIAYATCGFLVFLGAFRHPKFMDWAILLPLILQGADRLFDRKGAGLFVGALIGQFCISVYFSYMSCLVLLAYCLIKYFTVPRKRSVGDFVTLVAKFAAFGVLAFLVSGLFSLPQIIGLLSQGRATSGGTAVQIAFTIKYYAKVAAHFIGAAGTTEGLVTGAVSTIGVLGFLLCGKRFGSDERKPWLVGFVLCFAGVLIPFIGHVMNGMGYSTDRWMLVLAFVCSYILCLTLPRLKSFDKKDWRRLGIGVGVVAALATVYAFAQIAMADGVSGVVWPACMTVLFVGSFIAIRKLASSPRPNRVYAFSGVAILVCVSVAATFYLSPLGEDWGSSFPKAGGTWKSLSRNSPGAAAELIDDDGLWRYSVPRVYDSMKNSPLVHGVMGVDYYTSYYNQAVDDFRQGLGISDHHMNFSFAGSDSRLAIEDLTGVKYYICKNYDEWRIPFGFVDTGIAFNKYRIYRNENPAPLAFSAKDIVPASDYESLSMIQKQEALLQGAVVDESKLDTPLPHASLKLDSTPVEFEVVGTKGMDFDGNTAHVREKDATATIRFKGLAESETYLTFENLGFVQFSPSELARMQGKDVTLRTRVSDALWTRTTTYPMTAKVKDRSKAINPATPEHLRYGGKVDWVFNLGYSAQPVTEMTVEFEEVGDYTFDSMQVICQPVQPIVARARDLEAHALDGLETHVNGMSANVTLEDGSPEIAVFMFAYTPGWSVTVDGQPARALKVDTAFLGVEVSGAGTHAIEWTYTTPGVKPGSIMTIAGIAIVVVLLVGKLWIRRHAKSDGEKQVQ